MIADLVDYLAKALVDDPESVKVEEDRMGDRVEVRLLVSDEDRGKVIGRGGRIAGSMRQLVKVAAVKEDVRVSLDIPD
ncbi:MAG: KH domain-containing protein [Dehalococcoidia bacterium]